MFHYTEEQVIDRFFLVCAKGKRHEHYDETVRLAQYWSSIITGEGQQSLVLKVQESKDQQEQRYRIYNTHTPYLANRLKTVFQEVDRCDNINSILEIKNEGDVPDPTWNAFSGNIQSFYGNLDLDEYLDNTSLDLTTCDPNSFTLTDFYPFDPQTEHPKVYCTDIASKNVLDYEYKNGVLQFVIFREVFERKQKKVMYSRKSDDIQIFYLYTPDYSYRLIMEDDANEVMFGEGDRVHLEDDRGNKVPYLMSVAQHNSNNVPLCQNGYTPSLVHEKKIHESPYYPAKHLFNEHIQKKSSYDTHLNLYGYLRAYFYVPPCNNSNDIGQTCINGKIAGETCTVCGGSGLQPVKQIHRSEQDIMTLEMPLPSANPANEEIMDLSRLVHYVPIPTDVIDLTRKETEMLSEQISLALFNTNMFDRGELTVAKTATEIRSVLKYVNNVLYHFATFKARKWCFIVEQMARYYGIHDKITCDRSYPSDFKLETVHELLMTLKLAKESGGSLDITAAIERQIINRQYVDDPDKLMWIQAKDKFKPFRGMTEGERAIALGQLSRTSPKKLLWLYFDDIFRDIANRGVYETANRRYEAPFYNLTYDEQKEIIDYYIQGYIEQEQETISSEDEIAIPFDSENDE